MNQFTNFHLAISRQRFEQQRQVGAYSLVLNQLTVEETPPDYALVDQLLLRVGGPWGWPRRPKYALGKQELRQRLAHPEARLFLLGDSGAVVGYCLCTRPAQNLKSLYAEAAHHEKIIEIENFGLFPEHTGKGYGGLFLPEIFRRLLKTYDAVYLGTRSTNHAKVVPFYEGLGMTIIHREVLPDDLLPPSAPRSDPPDKPLMTFFAPSRP